MSPLTAELERMMREHHNVKDQEDFLCYATGQSNGMAGDEIRRAIEDYIQFEFGGWRTLMNMTPTNEDSQRCGSSLFGEHFRTLFARFAAQLLVTPILVSKCKVFGKETSKDTKESKE